MIKKNLHHQTQLTAKKIKVSSPDRVGKENIEQRVERRLMLETAEKIQTKGH